MSATPPNEEVVKLSERLPVHSVRAALAASPIETEPAMGHISGIVLVSIPRREIPAICATIDTFVQILMDKGHEFTDLEIALHQQSKETLQAALENQS
jgi:hypothetical protein